MPAKDSKAQSTDNGFSLISDEKLLALYAALLKCRMISRRTGEREPSIAAAVGVAIDLHSGDSLSASGAGAVARFIKFRFAKGVSLRRILDTGSDSRFLGGRGTGCAAVLKAALRAARRRKARVKKGEKGHKEKGKGEMDVQIAVAFCQDSSAPAQIWRESLREAARMRLPILFVCCAEEEAEDVQSLVPRSRLALIVADSNDVVAIYRVASEAIAHARRGNGPTLIVCRPWPPSVGDKARTAHAHDPILNMEKYLSGKRLFSAEFKRETTSRFARELRAAAHPIN